jgi:hypothetical protein
MIPIKSLIQAYLAGSASGQKAQAKPEGSCFGERRQGGPAMARREEAGLRCLVGSRFGGYSGRVRALMTKPVASDPRMLPVAAYAVSRDMAVPVMREVMQDPWHIHPTGEVPPCPSALQRLSVTRGHKVRPKRLGYSRVSGTGSPRPRPWGCQQRQSSGGSGASAPCVLHERLNLRVPRGPSWFMGQVSLTAQATKWPSRTSSGQPVSHGLRNSPQQPEAGHLAVHSC